MISPLERLMMPLRQVSTFPSRTLTCYPTTLLFGHLHSTNLIELVENMVRWQHVVCEFSGRGEIMTRDGEGVTLLLARPNSAMMAAKLLGIILDAFYVCHLFIAAILTSTWLENAVCTERLARMVYLIVGAEILTLVTLIAHGCRRLTKYSSSNNCSAFFDRLWSMRMSILTFVLIGFIINVSVGGWNECLHSSMGLWTMAFPIAVSGSLVILTIIVSISQITPREDNNTEMEV